MKFISEQSARINEIRAQLGVRLFNRLLAARPETKKATAELVSAVARRKKGTTKAQAVELCREILERMAQGRERRHHNRSLARGLEVARKRPRTGPRGLPGSPQDARAWERRNERLAAVIELEGRPAEERHDKRVQRLVEAAIHASNNRVDASAGSVIGVFTSTDPRAVRYVVELETVWDHYAKSCKYPGKEAHHHVTVPHRYLSRVYKPGLACVDGIVTLDAAPCALPSRLARECRVYDAQVVKPSRGLSVHVERIFIALDAGGVAYHGKSVEAAVRGLRKKTSLDIAKTLARQMSDDAFVRRLKSAMANAELARGMVSVADARAVGACSYGIESWCNSTGLPFSAGQASFQRVAQAYFTRPILEAKLTLLLWLRQHKPDSQAAA